MGGDAVAVGVVADGAELVDAADVNQAVVIGVVVGDGLGLGGREGGEPGQGAGTGQQDDDGEEFGEGYTPPPLPGMKAGLWCLGCVVVIGLSLQWFSEWGLRLPLGNVAHPGGGRKGFARRISGFPLAREWRRWGMTATGDGRAVTRRRRGNRRSPAANSSAGRWACHPAGSASPPDS